MTAEYELFKGKTLSGLFEDIYNNSSRNKKQLEVLVKEVVGFIKDGDTAVELIPMIKEYLEINVKNDDQLVKNFNAVLDTLEKEKSNNTVKGDLIKSAFITSTMGVSY